MEEQLGNELARAFFGSDSLLRRKARHDRQLQAALHGDARRRDQDDALTAAMRCSSAGGSASESPRETPTSEGAMPGLAPSLRSG